jgi:hypothetical protein
MQALIDVIEEHRLHRLTPDYASSRMHRELTVHPVRSLDTPRPASRDPSFLFHRYRDFCAEISSPASQLPLTDIVRDIEY